MVMVVAALPRPSQPAPFFPNQQVPVVDPPPPSDCQNTVRDNPVNLGWTDKFFEKLASEMQKLGPKIATQLDLDFFSQVQAGSGPDRLPPGPPLQPWEVQSASFPPAKLNPPKPR